MILQTILYKRAAPSISFQVHEDTISSVSEKLFLNNRHGPVLVVGLKTSRESPRFQTHLNSPGFLFLY